MFGDLLGLSYTMDGTGISLGSLGYDERSASAVTTLPLGNGTTR